MSLASDLIAARGLWGVHPLDWPTPPHVRPRWWQWRNKRALANLEAVFGPLSNAALRRYWIELRKGQSVFDDVGGYLERCYISMLGFVVEDPLTYQEAMEALSEQGQL